jgi:hypothetical protein
MKGLAMAKDHGERPILRKFHFIHQNEVPRGRAGKHKAIVTQLLNQIHRLPPGEALRVPLDALPDSKANIRAALNRATRKRGLAVSTSSDSDNLYIWNSGAKS